LVFETVAKNARCSSGKRPSCAIAHQRAGVCAAVEPLEAAWRKDLEGIAVREDEPADAFGLGRDHELAQRPARVVPDKRHIAETERLDQSGNDARERGGRAIDARRRCHPVDAERQRRHDTAEARRESLDDRIPHASGRSNAVNEHERWPITGHVVANGPAFEDDALFGCLLHGSLLY
jgi:hypothetical protein